MDRRHLSAKQPAPTILCHPPSLFFCPVAFWEPTSWLFSALFTISGLEKAWRLSSQTDPAQRGQAGTTSFNKLAPRRSVELCFLGSGIWKFPWKPQSTQLLAASSGKLPPLILPLPREEHSEWDWVSLLWEAGWATHCHPPGSSTWLPLGALGPLSLV